MASAIPIKPSTRNTIDLIKLKIFQQMNNIIAIIIHVVKSKLPSKLNTPSFLLTNII